MLAITILLQRGFQEMILMESHSVHNFLVQSMQGPKVQGIPKPNDAHFCQL